MTILLGFAVIAAGALLARLFRQWAKSEADSRKKMSDRDSKKSQPTGKPAAAQVAGVGLKRGRRNIGPDFGRR